MAGTPPRSPSAIFCLALVARTRAIDRSGYRAQTNNRIRHAGPAVAVNLLSEGVASLQRCGPDLQARPWTPSSSNVALAGPRDNRLRGFPQECTAPSGSGGDQAQGVIRSASPRYACQEQKTGLAALSRFWVGNRKTTLAAANYSDRAKRQQVQETSTAPLA
jgi:hypothetical protein